jgi:uncharacterized damage-inducible protein DinB
MDDRALGEQLAKALDWHDAHTDFDAAIANIPPEKRGTAPKGIPWSPWQLLEHIRRAQHGILEFSVSNDYHETKWPDDYWPESADPPSAKAWDESVRQVQQDRVQLQAMARDRTIELGDPVPNGDGQTYLRELVLAVDHTAYHVGQLIAVRRLLGIWPDE